MSPAVVAGGPGSGGVVPGWDRIGSAALVHTAQAVAAEALRAPLRDVRARVTGDGRGSLSVEVTAPLRVPVLGSGAVPTEPVLVTTHRARGTIADRVHAITGRQVDRVDVTYASSVVDVPRRVR
ncbi:hypothetical protein [Curtobacterium sp. B8]|uniref:hypothetical protein n=1 Tax=Curtobacterium sp. B8 TaxID=95611 RepID=UPI00034D9C48|nr:hypothetical protein [Curtobacterium sp. B8]